MSDPAPGERALVDLQWPEVCANIAGRTLSDLGRAQALDLGPAADEDTARLRQSIMAEVMRLRRLQAELPAGMFVDVTAAAMRVGRSGMAAEEDLAHMLRLLRLVLRLADFGGIHQEEAPQLARVLTVSEELLPLRDQLGSMLDEDGRVRDDASPALAKARAAVRSLRSDTQRRVQELISRYREALQDGYYAERDGRYVLPVRADAPFRVEGIVLGTSASGSTLYVEPKELGQLGNQLRLAEAEAERQLSLVLSELSETIRPHVEEILWAQEVCTRADLLRACADFGEAVGGLVVPFGPPGVIELHAARHPLLCLSPCDVVPSDLRLAPDMGLVLSGPNAGGKTVAMKTLGLCAVMQATGLPLPVDKESSVGFFEEICCDIGDDQSLSMSLSTFSGHVQRVRSILDDAGHGTLVLLDELMGGTDPDEGAALAIATMDALVKAGASVCVTTHYEPLKRHAAAVPHLVNGAVGFDFDKMEPTFLVNMGRPGASSALIVAERHGLPPAITKVAQDLLPEWIATRRAEALLVESSSVQLKKEKERLEGERARQEELNRRLERELDKLKEARRRDLAREGDELRMEIRQARAELRTIRKNIGTAEAKQHELSVDKVAALVSTSGKVTRALSSEEPPASPLPAEAIRVGDRVQVAGFGTEAEVLELPKKGRVRVLLGVMKMSVALADVVGKRKKSPPTHHNNNQSRTSASEALSSPQAPVRTQESTLDLRGQRVEESLLLVDQFIDLLLRLKETGGYVLHGHGTGALKEAVRVHLRAHTCVGQSRPAERDEGGDAFTVFWLAL